MRACAIAAIAVWAASSAVANAADVSAGGPVTGYGPYAYSPRIEPLIVYDYQPGVIVRSYWWSPWQNRHYFPKTGKRPKVGRLERVTARKSSPPQDFYRSWSEQIGFLLQTHARLMSRVPVAPRNGQLVSRYENLPLTAFRGWRQL